MFKLKKYYYIYSLMGVIVVALMLFGLLKHLSTETIYKFQEYTSEGIAKSISSSSWNRYSVLLENFNFYENKEEFKDSRDVKDFGDFITSNTRGLGILKLRVYSPNGIIVFSTSKDEIGDMSNDVLINKNEHDYSSIEYYKNYNKTERLDEFQSMWGIVRDKTIFSFHVPVFEDERLESVFEVFFDITYLTNKINDSKTKILIGVISILTLLFMFLSIIVNRADKIIKKQYNEQHIAKDKLRYQAFHDSLTGIPNRNAFNKDIDQIIIDSIDNDKSGALVFIDLDRFKFINDSLGHDAGDKILIHVADTISECIKNKDAVIYRISGDEFILVLNDIKDKKEIEIILDGIISQIEPPIKINGTSISPKLSIGITIFPNEDNTCPKKIVKEADIAMYKAKESKENNYEHFQDEMYSLFTKKILLEAELREAITKNEFLLYYQPKVLTETKEIIGLEALIRWNHPKLGVVSPDMFIPMLEEQGLINEVGKWVLLVACTQTQEWIKEKGRDIRISVNISAHQVKNDDFLESIKNVIDISGISPHNLELELTESVFIEDLDKVIKKIEELKLLGVKVSIDDFGSGYSSLSYLKNLPVDYLKVDKSFIHGMEANFQDKAIIEAVIGLGSKLNIKVIAEGVETVSQSDILEGMNCNELQGFLYGRPLSKEEINKIF